ncbi:HIT domain-containing protein [Micromonospora sp. BRA006-A]|nr:HIT domain-containing protein [Micromonospora sp. BRA006-A]
MLFCRIVAGEIPATIVRETATTLAFRDIDPKAPTHVLVIPKGALRGRGHAGPGRARAGRRGAPDRRRGRGGGGPDRGRFRLMFNTGPYGGQEVFHVHAHLLGGAPLGPMLCR